jgi:uncharacterized protein YfeS
MNRQGYVSAHSRYFSDSFYVDKAAHKCKEGVEEGNAFLPQLHQTER